MSVERLPSALRSADGPSPLDRGVARLRLLVRLVSFWSAVALPFLSAGLLASGLGTTGETAAFLALVGLNVLALVAGHGHARD
jgi:hypothetical protein